MTSAIIRPEATATMGPFDAPATAVPSNTWNTGSGWVADTAAGTFAHVATPKVNGTGSVRLTFAGDGLGVAASNTITPTNLTGHSFKVWVQCTNWALVSAFELRLWNGNTWDDPPVWARLNIRESVGLNSLKNGEWTEIDIPRSAFIASGTFNWAAVNHVQVMVLGTGAGTIYFNGIESYAPASKGRVTICFDDGWADGAPLAEPLMTAKGWVGSSFVIADLVDHADDGFTTQVQVDQLHAAGWDIGGHGKTSLVSLTPTERLADLKLNHDYLEAHGYRGRSLYAYPNGFNDDAIREDVAEFFVMGRTVDNLNASTYAASPYRLPGYSITNTVPLSTLKAYVDRAVANNEWAILLFHRLTPTAVTDIEYPLADFTALLDYIDSKNVDVVPMSAASYREVIDTPAQDIFRPVKVVLTEGFESGTGPWSGDASISEDGSHGGAQHLRLTSSEVGGMVEGQFILSDLNPGATYTFSFWIRSESGQTWTYITSDWNADHGVYFEEAGPWTSVSYEFTATNVTGFIAIQGGTGTAAITDLRLDDFTITRHAFTEHIPATYSITPRLPISDGKVRLDENNSPYVTANFSVPLTSRDLVEQIDPRDNQRVTVTATEGVSGVQRAYDLGLRSRKVNHKAGTIDIELASDEILLHDRRNVSTTIDTTPRTYESSLRAVCSWALGKVGATLEAGTTDADMTAHWSITNVLANPSSEVNAANWIAGSGASGLTRIVMGSPLAPSGTAALRFTAAAGAANVIPLSQGTPPTDLPVTAGRWYVFSAYVCSNPARTARAAIQWWSNNGTVLSSQVFGTSVATVTSEFRRISVIAQAPAGATHAFPYVNTTGNTAGNLHFVDCAMFYEGTELVPYFDGSLPDDADYKFEWQADAHASTSTREPFVERNPELFGWKPGQSLFEFLQPLLAASGLRLFCDETRTWRLVDPEVYEVPGYVVAQSGYNATEGSDEITRMDDTWADAVVVVYTWTDRDGESHTAYDAAGDPNGKTILRELNHEYPGPGAAAHILNSFTGRGRTQTVTMLGQYGAAPGQTVTISLPGAYPQTGKVRAVTFDLKSGLMDLETRGLIDTLPGSWALWDPTETWSEVDPGTTWNEA